MSHDADEAPRAACAGDFAAFDALTDHARGHGTPVAAREAARLCSGCALRPSCWARAKADGEDWLPLVVAEMRKAVNAA